MSKKDQQSHWYQRRKQMLSVRNHENSCDFAPSEIVPYKKIIDTEHLGKKSSHDQEVSGNFKE